MSTRTKTNMPGIFKSQTSRGVSYAVSYRDPSGKQHWRTFPTRQRALAFQAEQRTAIATGRYVEPSSRRTRQATVADVLEAYLDSRLLKQSEATQRQQRGYGRRHIGETTLGLTPLQAVRKADVDAWLVDREKQMSRSTLLKIAGLLRSTFRYAVETDRLMKAPPVSFTSADVDDHDEDPEEGIGVEIHPPTPEQVRALAAAMPNDVLEVMILTQFGSGMRMGELLGLRCCDVSEVSGQVNVTGQLVKDGRGRRGKPKTKHSRRSIPVSPLVMSVLVEHMLRHPGEPGGFLFTNPRTGRPISHRSYTGRFAEAVAAARLPDSTTTHDLRHAFATVQLGAGLTSVEVGRMLGHRDGSLVEKVYGHPRRDADRLARAAMTEAWSAEPSRGLALA